MNDANRVFENSKECSNAFQSVQKHRLQNPKNIVIGHINVNSLKSKFDVVEELVQNKVDIWFLSETKIDETFPNQQCMINGYKLFRRGRNCHGGGVLCYINENISSKTVNVDGIVKYCKIVLIESGSGIPELENRVKKPSYALWRHRTELVQIVTSYLIFH